jgi:Na+/glutamate symporter
VERLSSEALKVPRLAVLAAHWRWWALFAFAFVVVPFVGTDYWFSAILIPFLALSLAGLGLNLLTGLLVRPLPDPQSVAA